VQIIFDSSQIILGGFNGGFACQALIKPVQNAINKESKPPEATNR